MIREVETTVDLDTAAAKSKLRDLDKQKRTTKRRARSQVWGKMRARVGSAFGAFSGYSSITAVARMHSGPVDPWAAAIKPAQAAVQQAVDDALGFSAAGRRRARADTAERFGLNVGVRTAGSLTAAKDYYTFASRHTAQEEAGRNIIRQTLLGPTLDELLPQAVAGYTALLDKAFDYLFDGFTN